MQGEGCGLCTGWYPGALLTGSLSAVSLAFVLSSREASSLNGIGTRSAAPGGSGMRSTGQPDPPLLSPLLSLLLKVADAAGGGSGGGGNSGVATNAYSIAEDVRIR